MIIENTFSDPLYQNGHQYDHFYVIQNTDLNAGFVALLVYALNGVRRATQRNALPVLVFGSKDVPFFYEATKGPCIWDYYFQPISPVSYSQLLQWKEEGLVSEEKIHVNTSEEVVYGHSHDPERVATFWAYDTIKDKARWMAEKRALGRVFVRKHIQVLPHIEAKVSAYREHHFQADFMIGVHIRGTDFAYAQPTEITKYFEIINQKLQELGSKNFQIFLATDQAQYVEQFQSKYPAKVISREVTRSTNHIAPFKMEGISPYQKGEEVLMDMLLLSHCHFVIKGAAAVGEFALWFHDKMEIKDFGLESDYHTAEYYKLRSSFLKLNIGKRTKIQLWLQESWEFFVNGFIYFTPTRKLHYRFKWIRRMLKL